jgi:hypothetical protein
MEATSSSVKSVNFYKTARRHCSQDIKTLIYVMNIEGRTAV